MAGGKEIDLTSLSRRKNDDADSRVVKVTTESLSQPQSGNAPLQALESLVSDTGPETAPKTTTDLPTQMTTNTSTNSLKAYPITANPETRGSVVTNGGKIPSCQPSKPLRDNQTTGHIRAKIIDGTLKYPIQPIQRFSTQPLQGRQSVTPKRGKPLPSATVTVYGQRSSPSALDLHRQTMGMSKPVNASLTDSMVAVSDVKAPQGHVYGVLIAPKPRASSMSARLAGDGTPMPFVNANQSVAESMPLGKKSIGTQPAGTVSQIPGLSTAMELKSVSVDGAVSARSTATTGVSMGSLSTPSKLPSQLIKQQPICLDKDPVLSQLPAAKRNKDPVLHSVGHSAIMSSQTQSQNIAQSRDMSGTGFVLQRSVVKQSVSAAQKRIDPIIVPEVSSLAKTSLPDQKLASPVISSQTFPSQSTVLTSTTSSLSGNVCITSSVPEPSVTQTSISSRARSRKPPFRPHIAMSTSQISPNLSQMTYLASMMTTPVAASGNMPFMPIPHLPTTLPASVPANSTNVPIAGVYRKMVDTKAQKKTVMSTVASTTASKTNGTVVMTSHDSSVAVSSISTGKVIVQPEKSAQRDVDVTVVKPVEGVSSGSSLVTPSIAQSSHLTSVLHSTYSVSSQNQLISTSQSHVMPVSQSYMMSPAFTQLSGVMSISQTTSSLQPNQVTPPVQRVISKGIPSSIVMRHTAKSTDHLPLEETKPTRLIPVSTMTGPTKPVVARKSTAGGLRVNAFPSNSVENKHGGAVKSLHMTMYAQPGYGDVKMTQFLPGMQSKPIASSSHRQSNLVVKRLVSENNALFVPHRELQPANSLTSQPVSTASSLSSMPPVRRISNGNIQVLKTQSNSNATPTHVSDVTRARVQSHIKSKSSDVPRQSLASLMAPSRVVGGLGKTPTASISAPRDVSGKGPPPLIRTSGAQPSSSDLIEKVQPYKQSVSHSNGQVKKEADPDRDILESAPKRVALSVDTPITDRKPGIEKAPSAFRRHQRLPDTNRHVSNFSSHQLPWDRSESSLTNSHDVNDALNQAIPSSSSLSYQLLALSTTRQTQSHPSHPPHPWSVPVIDLTECSSSRQSPPSQPQTNHEPSHRPIVNLPHNTLGSVYLSHESSHIQQHGLRSTARHSSTQIGYPAVISSPPSHIHQPSTALGNTGRYQYEYQPQGVYMPPMVGQPHDLFSQPAPRLMSHILPPAYPLHSTLLHSYPGVQQASTLTSWTVPSVVTPVQVSESIPSLRKPVKPLDVGRTVDEVKTLTSPQRPRLFVRESSVERKEIVRQVNGDKDDSGEELYVDRSRDAEEEHSKEKLEFMACIGLITPRKLSEIRDKRAQRKRRARTVSSTLASATLRAKRVRPAPQSGSVRRGRLRSNKLVLSSSGSQSLDDGHGDSCAVCHEVGELLMCDTCSLVYHLSCLDPPLTSVPSGMWICPQCRKTAKQGGNVKWPGTLAVIQSYLNHKSGCETERKTLLDRIESLKSERIRLEQRAIEMRSAIIEHIQAKIAITAETEKTQKALSKLQKAIDAVKKSSQTTS